MVGDEPPRPPRPADGRLRPASAATSSPSSARDRSVADVIADLGHRSTVKPVVDRSALDYRRIAVSNRAVAGRHPATSTCLTAASPPPACAAATSTCSPPTTSCSPSATGSASSPRRPHRRHRGCSATSSAGHRHQPGRPVLGIAVSVCSSASSRSRCPAAAKISLGVAGGPPSSASSSASPAHRSGAVVAAALGVGDPRGHAHVPRDRRLQRGRRVRRRSPATTARGSCSAPSHVWRSGLLVHPAASCARTCGATLAGVISGTQTQPAVLAYSNDITRRPA